MKIVLLGGSGDLAVRKLLPAIPKKWVVTAYGRRKTSWENLVKRSKAKCKGTYSAVNLLTFNWNNTLNTDIVYCALPSKIYVDVLERMPLTKNMIVLCEKPVGHNTLSAKQLIERLNKLNAKVYYIDHYLGKGILETFYFMHAANPLLNNSWHTKYVESCTIYMKENATAKHRAEYYDQTGVIRDVVQNHGLQLLAHVLLQTKHYTQNTSKHRAQIIEGFKVVSSTVQQYEPYHNKKKVPTYAELVLEHKKWNKTTFKIVAGKGLNKKYTAVHLKMRLPQCPADFCPVSDTVILELYPTPRVQLQFYTGTKKLETKIIDLPLNIKSTQVEAYNKILESMPNTELVINDKEIIAQWNVVEPCLKKRVTKRYKRGSKK